MSLKDNFKTAPKSGQEMAVATGIEVSNVYVRRRVGEALNPNSLRGTVKHDSGGIMVWGSMSASGVGRIYRVQGTLKSDQYQRILQQKMVPSMKRLVWPKQNHFTAGQ